MKRLILFSFIFLLLVSVVSAQDLYADIELNAERDLYANINLDGDDKYVNIDGVNYKGYVDERTTGGFTNRDLARVFGETTEYITGIRTIYRTNEYHRNLAYALVGLMNYLTETIYDNWILPIQIKQNAIIKTLDSEVYCKNLAGEYFKAFPKAENFNCLENNQTYYKDLKFSIQVNNNP